MVVSRVRSASLAVALVALSMVSLSARADIVVGYTAIDTMGSIAADTTLAGVTAADVSRGPGITAVGSGGPTYRSTGFTTSPDFALLDRIEWGFSSTTPINLTSLQLAYNSETVGPRDLDVAVSVNGGGFTGIASVEDFAYLTPQLQTVDLSALTNVTSATFRIFPHQSFDFGGVPGTDRYFQLINSGSIAGSRSIVVNGVAVPEPSAFLFGLLVCAVTGTGYYFRSVRSSGEKS